MTMSFRDPRVLSEAVDTNSNDWFTQPPVAESVPGSSLDANDSIYTGGFVPYKSSGAPSKPPVENGAEFGSSPLLTYLDGTASTNVTKGPDEKDSACAPVSDSGLKNARGAGGGSIG